jgi:hypothetical protein
VRPEESFPGPVTVPYGFPNGSSPGDAASTPFIFIRAGANMGAFKACGVRRLPIRLSGDSSAGRERSRPRRSVMGVGKELERNNLRGVGFVVFLLVSFLPKMTTLGVLKELALPSRGAMITGLTSMADGADTTPDGLACSRTTIPSETSKAVK